MKRPGEPQLSSRLLLGLTFFKTIGDTEFDTFPVHEHQSVPFQYGCIFPLLNMIKQGFYIIKNW